MERGEKARLGRRAGSRRRGRKEVNKPCGTSEGANGLARDPRDPRRCWPLPQGEEPIIGPHPQASSGPGSHLLGPWGEVPTPATMEDMFGAATGPAPLNEAISETHHQDGRAPPGLRLIPGRCPRDAGAHIDGTMRRGVCPFIPKRLLCVCSRIDLLLKF